jgi:phosphohistidine phosphatase
VEIDQGVFKYVLLRLTDASSGRSKLLVRGSTGAAYHNHILQHAKAALPSQVGGEAAAASLDVQVLGGGRIEHYPEQRTISVYGYSAAFGPAVHEVTAGLVRKWHPWASVTHSYDGY